jgi:hypothetical protein
MIAWRLLDQFRTTAMRKQYEAMMLPSDGDTLPPVDVWDFQSDVKRPLDTFFVRPCAILAFYHSKCPGCDSVAVRWKEHSAELGGVPVPVVWLAIDPRDTAALSFHSKHNLPGRPVQLLSNRDAIRMRAKLTPAAFLMTDERIVLTSMRGLPSELDSIPADLMKRCQGS